MPPILIGTSGFSYSKGNDVFYPKGMKASQRLQYYAERFKTVEINMTFYRPVAEKTLLAWLEAVPGDFMFTMKAGKNITHYNRLRHCRSDLRDMWRQFSPLGKQLSCVLFQLPPSLKPDLRLLGNFLDEAREMQKKQGIDCRIAVEFRSRRWYERETFQLLDSFGVAPVLHDMPYKGGFWPIDENGEMILKSGHLLMLPEDWIASVSEHFFYLRFHGTVDKKPWHEYGGENLEPWATIAGRCLLHEKPVYAYFNNVAHGFANKDARLLAHFLRQDGYEVDLPHN